MCFWKSFPFISSTTCSGSRWNSYEELLFVQTRIIWCKLFSKNHASWISEILLLKKFKQFYVITLAPESGQTGWFYLFQWWRKNIQLRGDPCEHSGESQLPSTGKRLFAVSISVWNLNLHLINVSYPKLFAYFRFSQILRQFKEYIYHCHLKLPNWH